MPKITLQNIKNSVSNANETLKGLIQFATTGEVTTGTVDNKAISPKNLKVELDKVAKYTTNVSSGFSTGIEWDDINKRYQLFKNPQNISASVTANNSYTGVYNTSYELNFSGSVVNRYSRALVFSIRSTDTVAEQLFGIMSLGSDNNLIVVHPSSPGTKKVIRTTRGTQILNGFSTNDGIGSNVLLTSSSANGNTFSWWINWDDSTKKATITVAGVGGFGTHTVKFTADAFFI